MLKLCYKDYVPSRWLWLSVAVLYLLYTVQPLGQSLMVMVFGAMSVFGALSITLIWEDQHRTEALYAGLPLTRRRIVGGRYLLAGLLVLAGAVLIFGTAALGGHAGVEGDHSFTANAWPADRCRVGCGSRLALHEGELMWHEPTVHQQVGFVCVYKRPGTG